ncbi:type II secretion system F family protein [Mangrovihabitans endophyticus]|uniref:Tight adherence protein B n=1 Tax=Mangrovihabitans endophyticus TaxID=1751298 RepID=A0A8J3C091_9ACTN|nr:hypothetical protein GCM10012284_33720 [Mangrovihabitans endophyticus]
MIWLYASLVGCMAVVAWPRRSVRLGPDSVRRWVSRLVPATRTAAERVATLPGRRLLPLVAVAGALLGYTAAGPVTALVAGVYATLAAAHLRRRRASREAGALRTRTLDELSALTADLRAGLPPTDVTAMTGDRRLVDLAASVWRLAERTGAPAADLLDRIEADARAAGRASAAAAAQAAGAQATAMLLAALPLGGIALGYGIGVDPLAVLLHTPLGAGCAATAVLLQSAGLLWAGRLASP